MSQISVVLTDDHVVVRNGIKLLLENSHEIAIAKNNDKIIDNNTSLGAAGLLPNLIISSGYNASLSNTNLEFNPFVDFGTEEIDVSQALSSSCLLGLVKLYPHPAPCPAILASDFLESTS